MRDAARMTSLPRRFRRNASSSWARIGVQGLITIVMTPVLVHGLGQTEYGIWALAFSLVLYLELFEFGLGTATVKYVAESETLGDRGRLRRTVATSFWTLAIPGVGAFALAAAVALFFPVVFDVPSGSERPAQLLMLLVGLDLAVSIPGDTFGNTLVALQRFDVVNATLIAVLIAQAVSWVVILAFGGGLVALGLATVALNLLGQLSRFLLARRLVPGLSLSPRLVDRGQVRPLIGLSVWYGLAEASTLAIARLDTVVVGIVVGVPEAAVYAVAQRAAFLVDQVIRPILRMFFPHSSELAARRDRPALRSALLTGTRLATAVAGPLTLTLALLAEPALRAWVGPDYAEGAVVVVLLCAAAAISALTGTGFLMLQGAGFARWPGIFSTAQAILNLALGVVLGLQLGIKGVALAALIAASVVQIGLVLPYVARSFGLALTDLVWPVVRAHGPAAALAGGVGWLVLRTGVSGLLELVAAALAIGGVYLAVLAVTGLLPEERRMALGLLRPKRSSA